ncbi:MAG: CvpA family protein [Burkholderiales bacterium]|nr:MAG: CvpA family protein [Burkholderiales bacterium]
MGLTDWILLAVLLLSVLLGVWRGLVYEVFSVAGWVLAFVLAQAYAQQAARWLPLENMMEPLQVATGFAVVFVLVAFAGGFVSWLVRKMVVAVGLRPVDRVLGGAFGVLRGLVMLLGLAVVVSMTQWREAPWWRESSGAHVLGITLHHVKPILPQSLGQYLP